MSDLCTVTGTTIEKLCEGKESFLEAMSAYFPENLSRCFIDFDNQPDQTKLQELLRNRFVSMKNQADDFLARVKTFKKWKRTPIEKRKTPFPPNCTPEEVRGAHRSSRMNDGELVSRVFDLMNLYLLPETKFRQLPRGKQHRGAKDFEYQRFHKAIGQYTLKPKSFETLLKENRSSLFKKIWNPLAEKITELVNEEQKYINANDIRDTNGKRKKAGQTLLMLAEAATELYRKFCCRELENPQAMNAFDLRKKCRRYGVKTGMPLNKDSVIKTILRIDAEKWTNAYDYQNNRPYRGRELSSVEHVVSQIHFPNGFADRCVKKKGNTPLLSDGSFDFYRGMSELQLPLALRDYYNVQPLIEFQRSQSEIGINLTGYADFRRTAVDKARRNIKKSQYQDKLLLLIALEYRQRFLDSKGDSFKHEPEKETDIYDFFDTPIICERKVDGKRYMIKVYANDLTRPHFAQIVYGKNLAVLTSLVTPSENKFDFFDLQKKFKEVQMLDRNRRLKILPCLFEFESRVILPDKKTYEGKTPEEIWEMEYSIYHKVYSSFTRAEYEILVKARNEVLHDGFNIKTSDALKILNRLNSKFHTIPHTARR